jgi:hypothetical protein
MATNACFPLSEARSKMKQDSRDITKTPASGQPNPWSEMSTFEQVFLCLVLGALVLFVILVSVFWSWKAVGLLFFAALLSRIPVVMLLQLAVLAFLILLFGMMVLSLL